MAEPAAGGGLLERFPALKMLAAGGRKRIPFVQQTAGVDCGAACLSMVLAFHGRQVRLDDVRQVVGVGRDGANALALLNGGRWFGLRGRGIKVEELDDLRFLERGAILHWRFNHFVVFDGLRKGRIDLVDPAMGRRSVTREEFGRSFTGVALAFEPGEDFEEGDELPRGIGRYLRKIIGQSGTLTRILVSTLLLQLLGLAVPVLTGALVDRVVPRGDYHLLTVLAAGAGAIVVFLFLTALVRAFLLLHLRTHLDAQMTLEFLDHLVELPYSFFQQRSSGDLMMRLNSNSMVREILTAGALSGILDGTLVSLYLVLLFVTSTKMGAVVLGLGLLRVGLFLLTRKKNRDLMSELLQAQADSRSYQVQMLMGIETLKASGAEGRSVEHWSNLFVEELNAALARGRLDALVESLLSSLAAASPLVILATGGYLVLTGEMSLGVMLAANALAVGFLGPLSTLISTAFQLQLLGSYLDRINDVMETPKEQDRGEVTRPGRLAGRITVEEVSFRYSPLSPLVVREVSVDIHPGQFVAIVGRSGSGKSTFAGLLLGLYPPSAGTISYDSKDLRQLDLKSVRRQLGIVTQHPYLFGGSIRSNIALTDPTLPLARIVEAARRAHIHDDIMAMPMGYDTVMADGGASLSGGQRQRLALARALVHRPSILLLDEATSALDGVTEGQIHGELSALRATRIIIAHRLSTIRNADLILVMDQGRIVEQGSHGELLARGGSYAELVAAQVASKEEPSRLRSHA